MLNHCNIVSMSCYKYVMQHSCSIFATKCFAVTAERCTFASATIKISKSLRFYIALFATLQLCIALALQHGN